jgi:predicted peptidase
VRFLAPDQVADGKPAPLVIALHGAGGSENMFFDGYGHGDIVERCRRRGWLLVSTRYGIPDGLIDAVDALYPVDRKRIFVVGHSLGASQAMAAVSAKPDAFVAAAALGGGGAVTASDALKNVQIFVGVGAEDPVARGGALLLRDQLKKAGVKNLKFQEYEGAEHLTVVQLGLKDVFEFFDEAARR